MLDRNKIIVGALLLVIILAVGAIIGSWCSGEQLATVWALCKPGAQVMVRATPEKSGRIVGYLEVGDSFKTDAEEKDGWIRAYGIGDGGGWVYCGYVATEKPQEVNQRYVCVAKNRAACRKWCGGPMIEGKTGWIYNGTNVQVFYRTEDWSVTSRGYIRSEWLEVDPE